MRRTVLLFIFSLITAALFSNNHPGSEVSSTSVKKQAIGLQTSHETIINKAVIQRFNSVEFKSNHLTINKLIKQYNFNQVRHVANNFLNKGIDITNSDVVADIVSNSSNERIILRSESLISNE